MDHQTILWASLLILIFNQPYHQTHIADKLTYIIGKTKLKRYQFLLLLCSFFLISPQLFFLCCMINILRQMKKLSNRIDESNAPFCNTMDRLVWWNEWIHFFPNLFSRENCIWSPCFLFITAWLNLDTSVETTPWITFVCSLVCIADIGVSTPPQKYYSPRLSCQVPSLNQQTVQAPLFRQSPQYIGFRDPPSLTLKVWSFSEPQKY